MHLKWLLALHLIRQHALQFSELLQLIRIDPTNWKYIQSVEFLPLFERFAFDDVTKYINEVLNKSAIITRFFWKIWGKHSVWVIIIFFSNFLFDNFGRIIENIEKKNLPLKISSKPQFILKSIENDEKLLKFLQNFSENRLKSFIFSAAV